MKNKALEELKVLQWWKVLILLTFVISLIVLFSVLFTIQKEYVIKMGKFNTGYGDIFGEYDKFKVLHSECVDAEIYFPSISPDKIWINGDDNPSNGRGYCYIIYLKEVKVIRLRLR